MLIAPRLVGCGASPPAVRTPSLLKGAWRGHQAPLEGPDSASNQGRVAMDVRVSRAPRPPAGHRRGHRLPGTPRPLRPRPGLTVRAAGLRMEWSADQGARLIGRLVWGSWGRAGGCGVAWLRVGGRRGGLARGGGPLHSGQGSREAGAAPTAGLRAY